VNFAERLSVFAAGVAVVAAIFAEGVEIIVATH